MPALRPAPADGSSRMAFSVTSIAAASGSKVETIRDYESLGLLPGSERNAGNQRRSTARHYDRLLFILHARDLGLSIDAVRQLIDLSWRPTPSPG
jgi:DNA-binding transcriptional MerR regulator